MSRCKQSSQKTSLEVIFEMQHRKDRVPGWCSAAHSGGAIAGRLLSCGDFTSSKVG